MEEERLKKKIIKDWNSLMNKKNKTTTHSNSNKNKKKKQKKGKQYEAEYLHHYSDGSSPKVCI